MSADTQFHTVQCPYCGEATDLVVDVSMAEQQYIEDCQVCCRPMTVWVSIDDDEIAHVRVAAEDDG
ncbi:CPXCG motif-containing cysteine-rich protein [Stenotrophomonas sp. YIM B06876]|uniref:CPXCG motif-containing cysteine-rich protein n=1 Tax=Stenotrophomonas sp. YIM B06876 TaxID=3060211 RepID=UPI0027388A84|nr:CPXCG motif-containing cysteine-rich protein [Stenotrophomonas sp. YIM B06876]